MPKRTRPYRARLLESLTKPEEAASYLNAAMEDSPEMFLKAVKDVAQAHQMARVAKKAGVTRESLYRTFSEQGNPTLDTLQSVLSVFGLKMAFEADQPVSKSLSVDPAVRRTIVRIRDGYRFSGGTILSTSDQLSLPLGGAPKEISTVANTVAHSVSVTSTAFRYSGRDVEEPNAPSWLFSCERQGSIPLAAFASTTPQRSGLMSHIMQL